MMRVTSLLGALLFAASSLAMDVEAFRCSTEFAIAPYITQHKLVLGTNEHIDTLEVASGPVRLLVGTSITETPEGGTVLGGRFTLSHFGAEKPEIALNVPGLDGNSTSASVLVVSDDGKYAAVSGGSMFGGPAYFFDLQSSDYDPIASRTETRNAYRKFRDLYWAMIFRGLAGDPHAPFMLEQLGGLGEVYNILKGIYEKYGEIPAEVVDQLEGVIAQVVEGVLGKPGRDLGYGLVSKDEEEAIPTSSIDFSPDGKQYVADSIESLAVRDTVTGELDSRIYLTQLNGFTPLPVGGQTRFTNGGKHVVSYHRGYQKEALLALWDADKGFACDQQELDLAYDHYLPMERAFARSPDARFFVLSGKTKKGFTTQVWTTDPSEWAQQLVLVREFVSDSKQKGSAPPVAFSTSSTYAVGLTNGTVELYDADRNQVSKKFEGGHSKPVSAVAISRDGKLIVSVSGEENTLVLWSTSGEFEPIRLKGEDVGYMGSVRFLTDDNSQILLETYRDHVREVYLVDVFKMRAALKAKPADEK
ncbi:MAG: WD40 repeat domain-containing protein [Bdellovibrionota bacterium]